MKKLNVLANVELFDGIGIKDILSTINSLHAAIKKYQKGEILLAAGDPVVNAGIVLDGRVQLVKEDANGARFVVSELSESKLFAEAFSGARAQRSPVTVIAAADCSVLWIDIQKVIDVSSSESEHHGQLAINLLRIISQNNIELNSKVEILSQRTTRGRVMAYLNDVSRLQKTKRFRIPLNRIGLADFLCVDRSAMTRELSKMQKEGLIDFKKNEFEIL